MPYQWTQTEDAKTLTLWPHRSLPLRGFAAVMGAIFILAMMPLFGLIGTSLLWGMLPFVLLTLGGLYFAFMHTYRTGDAREELVIGPDETVLKHVPHQGETMIWTCNTYWTRTQIYHSEGPVPHYITLSGNGREAEVGRFLSEDERKVLIDEIRQALKSTAARD